MSDKATYAYIVRKLEEISRTLGNDLAAKIIDDDAKLAEKFFVIISDMMFDITGPIIQKYPSLRPPVMTGGKHNGRYNIVWHDETTGEEEIVRSDIPPSSAENVLQQLESAFKTGKKGFLYLEFKES